MIARSSTELRAAYDEERLVGWLRHYAAMVALFVVVGTAFGSTYGVLGREAESTTLVVDPEESVPAREFGVVGEAVFRSDAALLPAMRSLGITTTTERFLQESVRLRPVPDARILIVVGRASTSARARAISSTTADALVAALTDAGLEGLTVLHGGTTGRSLSPRVVAALGGLLGLWLGIGVAIASYHVRRPVLSLSSVLHLIGPEPVTVLDGRASWLGALRLLPRPRTTQRNERAISRLATQERSAWIVIPGGDTRRSRSVARTLVDELHAHGLAADEYPTGGPRRHEDDAPGPLGVVGDERTTLLVTDPRTGSRELALEALVAGRGEVHLLWIR